MKQAQKVDPAVTASEYINDLVFDRFAKCLHDDDGVSGLGTIIIRPFRLVGFHRAIYREYSTRGFASSDRILPCNIPRIFNKEVKVATLR